jgi:hypothetical protein
MELGQAFLAGVGKLVLTAIAVVALAVFLLIIFILARPKEPARHEGRPTAADIADRRRALAEAGPLVCSNCGAPRRGSQRRCSACNADGWISVGVA